MIDFHSHVLPGIDDGARNTATATQMLKLSNDAGVKKVVVTPHLFINSESSIDHFLQKRELAHNKLKNAIAEQNIALPEIVLGAEVHITRAICKTPGIEKLCIADTNYILLEMPYEPWCDWMFEEVYEISRLGLRPILAHLDRYISQEKQFSNLYSINALFQINASAFIDKATRRKVLEFFANDAAHVIGSDMHNLTTRPPNLAEAYSVISKKFGWEYVDYLQNNSQRILVNKSALPTRLPKLNFVKKLFI